VRISPVDLESGPPPKEIVDTLLETSSNNFESEATPSSTCAGARRRSGLFDRIISIAVSTVSGDSGSGNKIAIWFGTAAKRFEKRLLLCLI